MSKVNVNIGLLGHIDSGKTSLAKALSTHASTAAFDKSPQSKERGITLDLGFSAFSLKLNDSSKTSQQEIQITLVDCPGHASLIRTVIGGAQIIDLIILVIDVTKGVQTQTAEGLIIAELTVDKMIVVLNKIDQLPEAEREKIINKMTVRLQKTLSQTKFSNSSIVSLSATKREHIESLISILSNHFSEQLPLRTQSKLPFVFSIDHCFPIKGQGTVLTGTVLSGSVSVNQTIEIPNLKIQKKIKSIQMFHQPVQSITQGDRAGICVTQFDSSQLERGLASEVGFVKTFSAAIALVNKLKYFKHPCTSKTKLHLSIGHTTTMARCIFFSHKILPPELESNKISYSMISDHSFQKSEINLSTPYLYQDDINSYDLSNTSNDYPLQFVLLHFEKPVVSPHGSIVIASRLDTDIHLNTCRLAFYGKILDIFETCPPMGEKMSYPDEFSVLKIYKTKTKSGEIERVVDGNSAIIKNLFKKETDLTIFMNLKVIRKSDNLPGIIESSFGKSGKVKIRFQDPPSDSPLKANDLIEMEFKRLIFDKNRKKPFQ